QSKLRPTRAYTITCSTIWTSTPASFSRGRASTKSAGKSSKRSWPSLAARIPKANSTASAKRNSRRGASGRRCDEEGRLATRLRLTLPKDDRKADILPLVLGTCWPDLQRGHFGDRVIASSRRASISSAVESSVRSTVLVKLLGVFGYATKVTFGP